MSLLRNRTTEIINTYKNVYLINLLIKNSFFKNFLNRKNFVYLAILGKCIILLHSAIDNTTFLSLPWKLSFFGFLRVIDKRYARCVIRFQPTERPATTDKWWLRFFIAHIYSRKYTFVSLICVNYICKFVYI